LFLLLEKLKSFGYNSAKLIVELLSSSDYSEKIFYSITLILLGGCNLYADSTHSGTPGLINISTGVNDRQRFYGDKINENFKMIGSTINTAFTRLNNLDASTAAINARFTNVASTDIINGTIRGEDISVGAITATHTVATDFLFNTAGILRSSHMGVNFLQEFSTGTVYNVNSSTVNVSSITASRARVTSGDLSINGQNYTWPSGGQAASEFLQTDGSGVLSWATAGGGGGVNTSTFTRQISIGGDVFLSTNPFVAIPGAKWGVGKTTHNVTQVRLNMVQASTQGAISARIAESTGGFKPQFQYITGVMVVSTNTSYGVWTSTAFQMQPDKDYAVHITSIVTTNNNANSGAAEPRVEYRYWRDND